MVPVTRTYMPPMARYQALLERVWASGWVTTNGPLARELRSELLPLTGTKELLLCTNGTTGIEVALRAMDLQGEVITTAFSYVATTAAIAWVGLRPVLVDIRPDDLCIDPVAVEAAITPKTSAILATHVFGHPCDVEALAEIASKHNLQLIFDAAHAFATHYRGQPLTAYGDAAVLSFHATKLFHTVEGGAVVTDDAELAERLFQSANFGHKGKDRGFHRLGVNGKLSEMHAAMGLAILPDLDMLIAGRKSVCEAYDVRFVDSWGLAGFQKPLPREGTAPNYGYYPVLFDAEATLLAVRKALNAADIHPRRYFYPSLSQLPYVDHFHTPVADDIAGRILCLPLHAHLATDTVASIADIVHQTLLSC